MKHQFSIDRDDNNQLWSTATCPDCGDVCADVVPAAPLRWMTYSLECCLCQRVLATWDCSGDLMERDPANPLRWVKVQEVAA